MQKNKVWIKGLISSPIHSTHAASRNFSIKRNSSSNISIIWSFILILSLNILITPLSKYSLYSQIMNYQCWDNLRTIIMHLILMKRRIERFKNDWVRNFDFTDSLFDGVFACWLTGIFLIEFRFGRLDICSGARRTLDRWHHEWRFTRRKCCRG